MAANTSPTISSCSTKTMVGSIFLSFTHSLIARKDSQLSGSWGSSHILHQWWVVEESSYIGFGPVSICKGWDEEGLESMVILCSREIILLFMSWIICSIVDMSIFWLKSLERKPILIFSSSKSRQIYKVKPSYHHFSLLTYFDIYEVEFYNSEPRLLTW